LREGCAVAIPLTVSDRILEIMRYTPECKLDDLVRICWDFSWQEVLLEVNHLSREGQLQLTLISARAFTVRLVERESPVKACESLDPVRSE
jgi:hypothetical protein